MFHRFKVLWTPTVLVIDSEGNEHHRLEGYFPRDEFLAQLHVGLARVDFMHKRWAEAEQHYRRAAEQFPNTATAAEALYWAGVSRYKQTQDHHVLGEVESQLRQKYPDSLWTRSASVWAA